VSLGKCANFAGIGGLDGADKELLTFHDRVNARLRKRAWRLPTPVLSCVYSISRSVK
jgi:hypothetical protein